jgi:nucleotide-binding universal stress UspA family protein
MACKKEDLSQEVVKSANRFKADMIIMDTHGRSDQAIFGPVVLLQKK